MAAVAGGVHLEDGDKVAAVRVRPLVEALALLDDDAGGEGVAAQPFTAAGVVLDRERRRHEVLEGRVGVQRRLPLECLHTHMQLLLCCTAQGGLRSGASALRRKGRSSASGGLGQPVPCRSLNTL